MASQPIRVLIVLMLCLAAGCSQTPEASIAASSLQNVWPAPPDEPRFRYLGTLRSAADLAQKSGEQGLEQSVTPDRPPVSDQPVIYKPSAVAVRNGLVYVAEPAAKAVTVFDLGRRKLFRFGLRDPHALKMPRALALDSAGLVYVLDTNPARVMVYDALGLFVKSFDLAEGTFSNPVAIAVHPDGQTIYVVDRGEVDTDDHKVVAYDADGSERFRIGPRGSEPGRLNIPLAAAVNAEGKLYVVDAGNFRIQAFDAEGKFEFAFGAAGTQLGHFSRPRAIALDAEGNLYIADASFNNVQIFNPRGELLMPLGRLSHQAAPANYAMISGVAVDEADRLYILDNYFRKIEIFSRITGPAGENLLVSR
jgi:DNA-binding beta-propeller fold protein YncE